MNSKNTTKTTAADLLYRRVKIIAGRFKGCNGRVVKANGESCLVQSERGWVRLPANHLNLK